MESKHETWEKEKIMYSSKLKSPIADLDVKKRSLLFAELAEIAYKKKAEATKLAKSLGFTT